MSYLHVRLYKAALNTIITISHFLLCNIVIFINKNIAIHIITQLIIVYVTEPVLCLAILTLWQLSFCSYMHIQVIYTDNLYGLNLQLYVDQLFSVYFHNYVISTYIARCTQLTSYFRETRYFRENEGLSNKTLLCSQVSYTQLHMSELST